LELPVDGQRSLAELMEMYDANVGAPRSRSGIDDTGAAPAGVQVSGGPFLTPWLFGGATATNGVMPPPPLQQQQSAGFYVRDDALPPFSDIAAASPELRFSSGLNVPAQQQRARVPRPRRAQRPPVHLRVGLQLQHPRRR